MKKLLLTSLFAAILAAQAQTPPDLARRAEELKSLHWGMFICWSFSTFSGKEWTPGVKDIAAFKATEVDTDQWARTAREAGMGYILFLTKHHDGFCLWDTKTTARKVTNAPLKRDVLAELRKSCDKYGIKLALYFSEGEFKDNRDYHPGGYTPEMKKAQLKELLTQYGPIEYIWFDHAQTDGGLSHKQTVEWCHQCQPGTLIGFNHGEAAGEVSLREVGKPGPLGDAKAGSYNQANEAKFQGYLLAEFTYPILPAHKGGAQWFYSLPAHDQLCYPAEKLYRDYCGALKYGNIFSIDVGPDYLGKLREIDVATLRKVGEMIKNPPASLSAAPPQAAWKAELLQKPIRAFCIDFNWQIKGNSLSFAAPGHWADADPAAHVQWYKDIGANCIQTFVLSCNGYAWYQGGPIPAQPGLKSDFLTDVVRRGHDQRMLVMGYYCIGANSLWGQRHPDQSYGTPSTIHIPLTKDYLDYLCASVEDALKRTGIDGFMLDWLSNTSGKWLPCEQTMYAELMGTPFPGADKVTPADKARFDRLAVERCWTRIRDTARKVKPDCILWPNGLHHLNRDGVDWLLNEGPEVQAIEAARQQVDGRPIRLIQNQVGWPNHDARQVFSKSKYQAWDFYGFAAPYDNSLPLPAAEYLNRPIDAFTGTERMKVNDRNIAALVRFYLGKPVEPPAGASGALSAGKPARASSVWGRGFEAGQAVDGDESTRWGAAPNTRSGWLEIDLGRETPIGRAVVMEVSYPRTEEFALEYKAGDAWKELHHGKTIAGARVYDFAPVTARYVRLNILQANEVPTIDEFQVYPPGAKLPEALEKTRQEAEKRAARLQWFDQAKYGLFINWGLYSIPAGEWKGKPIGGIGEWIMHNARVPVKEYEQLATRFNPAKFNADEWAQLAVDAGMKYVVFDCKHHDGFALYHSQVSRYNCYDATPWKRDPFKELQQACAKRGLKLCFYYSQATDWHEPNGANNDWDFPPNSQKDFDQYLRDKSMPQVRELLTGYGPIGLIWFDVPTLMTPERSKRLADLVHSLQPDTLINSRLGPGGYHDYSSRGDNEIPPAVTAGAWETAATINDTWGYKKDDHHWKSPEDICFKLVDIVSKGGNYLLNVGPDGDGFIPQPSQDILRQVGAWLKVNGEAIYGAGRTPFGAELGSLDPVNKDKRGRPLVQAKTAWRCTTQPGKLYIHLFQWPGPKFELGGLNHKLSRAYLLTDRQPLQFTQAAETVSVSLPQAAPGSLATVLCLELQAGSQTQL